MPTKDMTRRRVFCGVAVAAMAPAAASAELVLNFPLKGDARLSRDASSTLLYGASQILGAIQLAEIDREKASGRLKEGLVYLDKARGMFQAVQKMAGSAPLNPAKAKMLPEGLARIQNVHKITIPKTMDGLSALAISEVDRFIGATKEMGFDSLQKARQTTLTFSAAINRLLDVGVFVSDLAETAESK